MLNFDNPPYYALIQNEPLPKPSYHAFDPIDGNYSRQGKTLLGSLIIQPIIYRWDYRSKIRFDLLFIDKLHQPGWICLSEDDAHEVFETLLELKRSNINFHSLFLCLGKARAFGDSLYRPRAASYFWASTYQTCYGSYFRESLPRNPWEML
jgi:hypothetical protein